MTGLAAHTHTLSVPLPWASLGSVGRDDGVAPFAAALGAVGLGEVEARRRFTIGAGVLHHHWTASIDDWRTFLEHADGSVLDQSVGVAATVYGHVRGRGVLHLTTNVEPLADRLGMPVHHVVDAARRLDHGVLAGRVAEGRWLTVGAVEAIVDDLHGRLPEQAIRLTADQASIVHEADGDGELHRPATEPAPNGARMVVVPDAGRLAAAVLDQVRSPHRPDGSALLAGRLAVRLDVLASWRAATGVPSVVAPTGPRSFRA